MNSGCALLLTLSFSSFPSSWQSIIIPYLKQNANLLIFSFYCYLTPQTTERPEQTSLLTSCLLFKSAPPSAGDAPPKEFPHSPLASRTPLHSTLPDYNFTKQKFLTFAKENLEDKYFLLYSHLLTSHFNKSFGFLKALNQKKTDTLPILPIAHILKRSGDRFIFVQ